MSWPEDLLIAILANARQATMATPGLLFEILPYTHGVAPPGATVRIGPRFWFRCVSISPGKSFVNLAQFSKDPSLVFDDYESCDITRAFDAAGLDVSPREFLDEGASESCAIG